MNIRKLTTLLVSCLMAGSFVKLAAQPAHHITIKTEVSKDATSAVREAVMKANMQPNTVIKFEPGVYNFYPDKAQEKYLFISNHDDHLTRIAFSINEAKNLIIDGNGAKFIMHGVIIPFLVEKSQNVIIKNLSVDWANPFHSQGKVISNNIKNKTFDVSFSSDYPFEIRDGEVIFLKEYYTHDLNQGILFDPKTRGPLFKTETLLALDYKKRAATRYMPDKSVINYPYPIDNQETMYRDMGLVLSSHIEQVSPGVLRLTNRRTPLPPVGSIFVCKGRQDLNRVAPAFFLLKSKDLKLSDVTIYHAGGMGVLGQNSENIDLTRIIVTTSGDRIISASADATHFVGCRGHINLDSCLFENQLDDALNVHGTYQIVEDIINTNTLGLRMGHFQQLGFTLAQPGDTIGFVKIDKSFSPYAKAIVEKVISINGRYQKIIFKTPIPKQIAKGDLLENISAYPTLTVENSTFRHNRARGLLLSTPKKIIVKNCYFETEMDGLLLPVENSNWYESGSVADVLIEGNTFKNCATLGKDRPVIRFATDGDNDDVAFRNIVIKGNIFDQFSSSIMTVTNTANLQFIGNIIKSNDDYENIFPDTPAVQITKSSGIIFKGNKFKGHAKVQVRDIDTKQDYTFRNYKTLARSGNTW